MTREGPFWDVMEGRAAPPPAAILLGWELVAVDPEAGTIEVAFTASEQFLNPAGVIQGGFLAAMLDDTLGPALVATLGPGLFAPTTDLHVQFLRPARPGRLTGHGRIVRRGREVAFLAGELHDESGQVVATAVATAQVRSLPSKESTARLTSGRGARPRRTAAGQALRGRRRSDGDECLRPFVALRDPIAPKTPGPFFHARDCALVVDRGSTNSAGKRH